MLLSNSMAPLVIFDLAFFIKFFNVFKRRSLPSVVVVVASVVVRRCLSSYVVVRRHVRPSSSAAVRRRSLSWVVFFRAALFLCLLKSLTKSVVPNGGRNKYCIYLQLVFSSGSSVCGSKFNSPPPLPPNFNVARGAKCGFRGAASLRYPLSVRNIYCIHRTEHARQYRAHLQH